MSESEANLLRSAQAGNRDALGALLEIHTPLLHADLMAKMPERWRSLLAVEDVLQETFTDAFLGIRAFVSRGDGALRLWLRKLARNNLIEAIRGLEADKRGGGLRRVEFDSHTDARTTFLQRLLVAGAPTTPSQNFARREAHAMLAHAMASLPERYRLAIQRYDLEGKTIQETAAELGCSHGGTHLVRNRALQRLRALLARNVSTIRPQA
ncbi:MAG: sigma-70 family RNA polymerase sigma factor [Phycisphaerae bacterium]